MAKGRRQNLAEIGRELNIVPYLDIMMNLVMFMLINITSFVSFTILNASIPQLAPSAAKAQKQISKKAQLLLMVRVTKKGFAVDPSVQGGSAMKRTRLSKTTDGYDFEGLSAVANRIKQRFAKETRVLIIADPFVVYEDIIRTMDALRETEPGKIDLFPDVTLSIL